LALCFSFIQQGLDRKLDYLAGRERMKRPHKLPLAERIDITLANLSILKTGKARAICLPTLGALCDALGCQPGELL
jgi:putative transcriptional regulator